MDCVAGWLNGLRSYVIATVVMCHVLNPACSIGRYINGRSIKKCLDILLRNLKHSKYWVNTNIKTEEATPGTPQSNKEFTLI